MKKNTKVKIYFHNNISVEGIIHKYSKKKLVLKTEHSKDKIVIFNPQASIMMIRTYNLNIVTNNDIVEEENQNHFEQPTLEQPQIVKVGQVWEFVNDKSRWIVTDTIDKYATLENVETKKTCCPERTELRLAVGWKYCGEGEVPKYEEEAITTETKNDFDLKLKSVAELKKLKAEEEKELLSKKIKEHSPGNIPNNKTTYELPNFNRPIISDTSKKDS